MFIEWVNIEIAKQYKVTVEPSDWLILDSCNEKKLSFHLILQNKLCFDSVATHKIFINHLFVEFPKQDPNFVNKLSWLYENKGTRFIFDHLPYKPQTQNIRLVNQSKKGDTRTLKLPIESHIPLVETLIGLYNGTGNRRVIFTGAVVDKPQKNKTTGKVKKQKPTDKKNRESPLIVQLL